MKIVHTSDWHIGRRWKGIQRLDELAAVLDHLSAFIEESLCHHGGLRRHRAQRRHSRVHVSNHLARARFLAESAIVFIYIVIQS